MIITSLYQSFGTAVNFYGGDTISMSAPKTKLDQPAPAANFRCPPFEPGQIAFLRRT